MPTNKLHTWRRCLVFQYLWCLYIDFVTFSGQYMGERSKLAIPSLWLNRQRSLYRQNSSLTGSLFCSTLAVIITSNTSRDKQCVSMFANEKWTLQTQLKLSILVPTIWTHPPFFNSVIATLHLLRETLSLNSH